jgi:hypothetical protein
MINRARQTAMPSAASALFFPVSGLRVSWRLLILLAVCWLAFAFPALAADAPDCTQVASDACLLAVQPAGSSLKVLYYASLPGAAAPLNAVIAMHGHSHDASKTFDATLAAARTSSEVQRTLVVAPILQVDDAHAARCSSAGVPEADGSELTWSCDSWMEGAAAQNDSHVTSFAAIDALIGDVKKRWPIVQTITLAGFSAGAQMVQHYIGFAAAFPAETRIRFVVADPGSWLYFDPVRPVLDASPNCRSDTAGSSCAIGFARPDASTCAQYDRWKYGLAGVPASLPQPDIGARARYVRSEIYYLEGELDSSEGPGRAARVLDRSCPARLQGTFRLQRGQAYEAYDVQILAPPRAHPLAVVPGCAHDVACVFPSDAGRQALFQLQSRD